MANLKIDIAAEFTGAKAFKKAETSTDRLSKGVKKLGAAMAAAFSVQAITSFGAASVKAFAEDEKAAARLAKVVENLGLAFANPAIDSFIERLTITTGVSDDKLRPAFQALLTTTGSLTNSQELLTQAIDIAAGSGVDLATVAQDLANAYVGNTKGLKKYNLGLSQAQLKTKSFTEIQELLNKQFTGSNAAYLETYAGKMEMLSTASEEAKEIIGKGLVDALFKLTGNTSVEELAADMKEFATQISNVITALTGIYDKFQDLKGAMPDWLEKILYSDWTPGRAGVGLFKWLAGLGAGKDSMDAPGFNPNDNALTGYKESEAAKKKAEAEAKKRATALVTSQKANTAELKKQALLKKQATLFDLQQIQLVAALKGKLTDDERDKIKLQLALLQGNEYEAAKLTDKIANSIDATGKLAQFLRTLPDAKNPFVAWKGYLDALELQAKRIAAYGKPEGTGDGETPSKTIPPIVGVNTPIPATNAEAIASGNEATGFNRFGVETKGNQTIQIELNIDGKQIAKVLQDASLNGNQVYVNRITGGFYQ